MTRVAKRFMLTPVTGVADEVLAFAAPSALARRAGRGSVGVADVVVCGDDVRDCRPSAAMFEKCMALSGVANPVRVANVGDTVMDLRAGHRAGVRFNIGVLSGARNRTALEAERPIHIIESVADLPAVLTSKSPNLEISWKAFVKENCDRTNTAYLQKTTLPYEDNYRDLDPEVKDPLGDPVLRITADYKDNERRISTFIQDRMERWYRAAERLTSSAAARGPWG